jgi:hypothetical protein
MVMAHSIACVLGAKPPATAQRLALFHAATGSVRGGPSKSNSDQGRMKVARRGYSQLDMI